MMELFFVIFWCHFLNLVLVLSQGYLSYILLRKEEKITGQLLFWLDHLQNKIQTAVIQFPLSEEHQHYKRNVISIFINSSAQSVYLLAVMHRQFLLRAYISVLMQLILKSLCFSGYTRNIDDKDGVNLLVPCLVSPHPSLGMNVRLHLLSIPSIHDKVDILSQY